MEHNVSFSHNSQCIELSLVYRLVVIADKNKVHTQFPIPLINRLEKHYVSATSLLDSEHKEGRQREVKQRLEVWAEKFVKPMLHFRFVLCTAR